MEFASSPSIPSSAQRNSLVEAKKAHGILVDVARFRHKIGPDVHDWRIRISRPRKVKIIERAETTGDDPTRSERPWEDVTRTLCYVRFGCFPWSSAFSPQP
jgi:hypothetical protein